MDRAGDDISGRYLQAVSERVDGGGNKWGESPMLYGQVAGRYGGKSGQRLLKGVGREREVCTEYCWSVWDSGHQGHQAEMSRAE